MRKSKNVRVALSLVVLLIVTSLAGCATSSTPAEEHRIVALAPSGVEIVYALGLEDSLVGWSMYTDYPPQVADVKGWVPYEEYEFVSVEDELSKDVAVVSRFVDYNYEVVKALEPTLIIACESLQTGMVEELRAKGYKVIHNMPATLDDIFATMLEVGEATGTAKRAQELVDGYKKEIEEIRSITADLPKIKTYLEIGYYGNPWALGAGSPMDQVVEIAGGVNIFADTQGSAFQTTNEEIVARNPEVILSPLWPNAGREEVISIRDIVIREGYEDIESVMNSRVYHYDSSMFKRPSPRQVTAIHKLAYLLHPYYFDNPENSVSPWELGKIDETYAPPAPLR